MKSSEQAGAKAPDDAVIDASVIIVSFNTRNILRECLESVAREAGSVSLEILVVDNASSDGSPEMIEQDFPHVRLFRSKTNLGFGAANNVALAEATGRYFVLLNSDAFFEAGALRRAIEHMDQTPDCGIGGARLVGRDGTLQPSARMFHSIARDMLVLTGLAAKRPKSRIFGAFDRTWADPGEAAAVDWVPGAFSILRPEAIAKVGMFDPAFFLYYEEVDLCLRDPAGRLYRLVLAGRGGDPCRWRIFEAAEDAGVFIQGGAGGAVEDAQHAALLPQAPWLEGAPGKVARDPAVQQHGRPESLQPQPGAAGTRPPSSHPDRAHEAGLDGYRGGKDLALPAVVTVKAALAAPVRLFLRASGPLLEKWLRLFHFASLGARLRRPLPPSVVVCGRCWIFGTGAVAFGANTLLYPELHLETQGPAEITLGDAWCFLAGCTWLPWPASRSAGA